MRRIVFAAFMMPTLASGAVYKCVDSDGKITFSDRACDGVHGGAPIDIKPSTGPGTPQRMDKSVSAEEGRIAERYDRVIDQLNQPRRRRPASVVAPKGSSTCKEFSSPELRTLIIRNQVVVGMKISDALKSWGTPESINGTQYAYFWEKGHAFFYDRGGCVSTVQGSYVGGKFVR